MSQNPDKGPKKYKLIGPDGKQFESETPGIIGGYKAGKIFGRLDCPSAARWIAKGHYVKERVFFASEQDARQAGYRPCGVCMKRAYEAWKAENGLTVLSKDSSRKR